MMPKDLRPGDMVHDLTNLDAIAVLEVVVISKSILRRRRPIKLRSVCTGGHWIRNGVAQWMAADVVADALKHRKVMVTRGDVVLKAEVEAQ
jgi:hypothetical protein